MSDFPQLLYRDGSSANIWGHDVDLLTVNDPEELARALRDGWRETVEPEARPEPKPKPKPKPKRR